MAEKTLTTLRVSPELLARIDELVERLAGNPAFLAFRVSRASLLRLAVQRGIDAIDAEYQVKAPPAQKTPPPPPPERREKPTRRAGGPRPDAVPRRKDERKAAGFPAATGGE